MESEISTFKKVLRIAPVIFIFLLSIVLFFYITPDRLVEVVGLENAYFLMFFTAFLGGLTTFNTVPYYSILLVLAGAGLNPLLIGLSSAVGVMAGDSFSYFMGNQGVSIIPTKLHYIFDKVRVFALTRPKLFPILCFAYGSLSPFSNDFITISAGMARIPFARIMIPLALGNLVFNIGLSYLALHSYNLVSSFLIG